MELNLELVSLLVGVMSLGLGILAFILSIFFYRQSSDLNRVSQAALTRIEESSKVTEVTSTEYTRRMTDALIQIASENVRKKVEDIEAQTIKTLQRQIQEGLQIGASDKSAKILEDVKKNLSSLTYQIEKTISQVLAPEKTSPSSLPASPTPSKSYMPQFIRRMAELEKSHNFLSVKWLHQDKFLDDPPMRECLQTAIDEGVVKTYPVDNPKNPGFPVTACKLDRDNPLVLAVLSSESP